MTGDVIEKAVAQIRKPQELGGFLYRPHDWVVEDAATLVRPGPAAAPLGVKTLGALRDYLVTNRDTLDVARVVVHVESPAKVAIGSALRERRDREWFLTATADDLTSGFLAKFLPIDEFIIGVQVRFLDTEDRQRLLRLVGNISHDSVKSSVDDGITQVVQTRSGVALKQEATIPNPVTLTPYRTFRDVLQPASPFVVRVNAGKNGGLPEVGLFEADGGVWRLTAVERVRDWLIEALPDGVAVLA